MATPATVAAVLNSPMRLAKDGTLKDPAQMLEPTAGENMPGESTPRNTPARGALRLVN